jgi:hypothetical protein
LFQIVPRAGFKFEYEYDFGDSWEHEIKVEKALVLEKRLRRPVCLDGRRACPPEDVGGTYGYKTFMEALRDPVNEEHDSYLEWAGGEFDPAAFDLKEANERIKHLNDEIIVDEPFATQLGTAASNPNEALARWLKQLDNDQAAWAEKLVLRRDMITLLEYLQVNRVSGTSTRGNFPLKTVREITAKFVNPPKLDQTIENYTFKMHSEEEVWPLYQLHVLGVAGGLLEGGQSKKWRVTQAGEGFLDAAAPIQAWALFSTWWMAVNWLIAFPLGAQGNYLPDGFKDQCRQALLKLPAGERIEFELFANQLIKTARLTWPNADPDRAQEFSSHFVERTLIDPLTDFELIVPEIQTKDRPYGRKTLMAFELKQEGKNILETLGRIEN